MPNDDDKKSFSSDSSFDVALMQAKGIQLECADPKLNPATV